MIWARTPRPLPPPPRVDHVVGPRGRQRLKFGGPSVNTQAPKGKYSDLLRDLKRVYRQKRPYQKFVTFSPFARRSPGPINYHISLLDSRIESFGPDHFHIKTLSYYSALNQGKRKIYGGKRPTKDTLYDDDSVHLKPAEVDKFLYCLQETRSRLRTGTLTPDRRFTTEPKFRVKF